MPNISRFRGTVFVDLAALPSDSEVEFNLQIPNNGYLAFSVTALGFNPRGTAFAKLLCLTNFLITTIY